MHCCIFCSYQSDDNVLFLKHLFEAHSLESNFSYTCGFDGCRRIFTVGASYDAFRSHCDRKHNNWKESFIGISYADSQSEIDSSVDAAGELADANDSATSTPITLHPSGSVTDTSIDSEEDMDINEIAAVNGGELSYEHDRHEESNIISLELAAASFVLNLKEKFKLSQASLNFAIKAVEEIIEISTNNIQDSVLKTLRESSISANVAHCFTSTNPFISLKTEYQQTKVFKEHFGYIVSLLVNNFLF